jgi:hypothetical protein
MIGNSFLNAILALLIAQGHFSREPGKNVFTI